MKKIVGKNQVIITALAILIAVAGYLNYSEKNALNQTSSKSSNQTLECVSDNLANAETNPELDQVSADAQKEFDEDNLLSSNEDILSYDGDLEENETSKSEPGEAVLTSTNTFAANAKLSREQVRSQNKETLLNTLNSANLTDEQKNQITNEMIHITQIAEMENDTETLLAAKGFMDTVVSIGEKQVDVVLNMTNISDSERAQIEDVVKRKTGVSPDNIIITPVTSEN